MICDTKGPISGILVDSKVRDVTIAVYSEPVSIAVYGPDRYRY